MNPFSPQYAVRLQAFFFSTDTFCLGHLLSDKQCSHFPRLLKLFCLTLELCRFPMSDTEIRSISYVWHNDLAKSSTLTLRITAFCYVASGLWQHFPFTHRFLDTAETITAISKLVNSRPSIRNGMVSTLCCFMCLKSILELYLKISWIFLVFPDSGKTLLKSLRIWWKYWSRFLFARMYCTVQEASQNTWNNKKRKQWDWH